jgi:hypothetical protein
LYSPSKFVIVAGLNAIPEASVELATTENAIPTDLPE